MRNYDYLTPQQAKNELVELERAVAEHECDHTNCIPRSSLPELPSGWDRGSFEAIYDEVWCLSGDDECLVGGCSSETDARFLASLLNAVYGKGE